METSDPFFFYFCSYFNPLNTELNSICHLLTLVGAHHILHVSRVRVNITFLCPSSVMQGQHWTIWRPAQNVVHLPADLNTWALQPHVKEKRECLNKTLFDDKALTGIGVFYILVSVYS